MTFPVTWLFDSPGAISYRYSIVTESLSPAIYGTMGPKHIGVTAFTFLGHLTSSVTWPIDPPYVISYWYPIGVESLSSTIFEIFASTYIWVTTLTFLGHVTPSVTWPFDSACAISYRCSIETESLSPTIFEIMGIFISGSRPWFSRSRDVIGHVTNQSATWHFLLVSHWNRMSIFNRFRDICIQM